MADYRDADIFGDAAPPAAASAPPAAAAAPQFRDADIFTMPGAPAGPNVIEVNGVAQPEQQAAIQQAEARPPLEVQQAGPSAPSRLSDVGRQLGLSLRAPVQAAIGAYDTFLGNPATAAYNLATGERNPMPSEGRQAQLDRIFPRPETDTERLANVAATAGYGAMGSVGLASLARPTSAAGQAVQRLLTTAPGSQAAGAAASAGVGEKLRQEGQPWWAQFAGSLLAAPLGAYAANRMGQAYQRWDNLSEAARAGLAARSPDAGALERSAANVWHRGANIDAATELRAAAIAQQAGVDWAQLPVSIKQQFTAQVREALAAGQPIDPTQAQRWLRFQQIGAAPTRAMVTRDPMDWAREDRLSNIQGVGEPILAQREAVGNAVRAQMAGSQPGNVATGRAIAGDLSTIRGNLEGQVRSAYRAADQSADAMAGVPIEQLRRELRLRQSRAGTQPQYQTILAELDRLSGGNPSLTQRNVEELRKTVNALRNPADAPSMAATNEIRQWIDDAIGGTPTPPAYREARELNTLLRATVDDQPIIDKLTAMATRVNRETPFDEVYDTILRAGPDGIRQVRNTLEVGGRGQQWQVFKDRVMEDLAGRLNTGSTTGDRAVTFLNRMANLRDELPAIFDADELRRLQDLARVVEYAMTAPRGSTRLSNPSGTAGQLAGYVQDVASGGGAAFKKLTAGILNSMKDAAERSSQRREVSALTNPALIGATPRDAAPWITPAMIGLVAGQQGEQEQ